MNGRVFLDTSVLVYAYDLGAPAKQRIAQQTIAQHLQADTGCLSAQVLSEFYVTVTRKLPAPLEPETVAAILRLLGQMPVMDLDARLVHRAVDAQRRYRISYWDALVVAAAERAQCETVLSEDLAAGQTYLGVTVVNPFAKTPARPGADPSRRSR